MSLPWQKTRVYVNDVEVTNSPVEEPVRVRVEKPMPPLPFIDLDSFTETPKCCRCNGRKITFAYWARYHAPCPVPLRVVWPEYPYRFGSYQRSPQEMAEYEKQVQDAQRVQATVPPHHDLSCVRCGYQWAVRALEEEACE